MRIKYKIKTRYRSMTIAEMLFSMALIGIFLIISAPLISVRAKMQGQDLASIMCIKNVLAADANETISESACASKPDNPCCKAVKYCRYDQNNACSTLQYYADNGIGNEVVYGAKALSAACDQGGKEGCRHFVVNCNQDNSTCDNSTHEYDLQYYLNLPVSSSNLSKTHIIDMAGTLYNEGSPNITYWVNNTNSCPVDNIAYYIRGLTCTVTPPTLGFPQMKLTPPNLSSQATMGYNIKVDPSNGNVYMVGGYFWDHSGGSGSVTASDIYLVKMNSSGSMESPYGWQKQIYSTSLSADCLLAHGLAIDSLGNVYVGVIDQYITAGLPTIFSAGGMGILKFDSNGNLLWQKRIKESSSVSGVADLAVDNNNNLYIAGFDLSGNATGDMLAVRMNSSGNITMQKRINSSNNKADAAYGIAVDSVYNIYLTGYSNNGSNLDIAFVKMNSLGNITVQKRINSSNNKADIANAIKLDSTGSNAYIAGFSGTVTTIPFVQGLYMSGSSYFSILKLSTSDGSIGYQKVFNNTASSNDHITNIALDSNDNVYMVGYSAVSNKNMIVLKMNSSGSLSSPNGWKVSLSGNSTSSVNDYGMGIAVGPDNYIYVTGFIANSDLYWDQAGMSSPGPEAVLLKMSFSQTDQNSLFGTPTSPYNNISSPFNGPVNMDLQTTNPFNTFYNLGVTINHPGYTFNN